jgi:hypothetical protein
LDWWIISPEQARGQANHQMMFAFTNIMVNVRINEGNQNEKKKDKTWYYL